MKILRWVGAFVVAMLLIVAIVGVSRLDLDGFRNSASSPCLASLDPPATVVTGVFVEPDDGYNPVLDEITGARCQIDVSVYLLTDEAVMEALDAADDRGVQVRVQLEKDPFGGGGTSADDAAAWLESHGIDWRWTPARYQFSHAKYMVIDQRVAVIMNLNLSTSAFASNREFGAVTTDPAIVADARTVFDADWRGKPLTASLDRLVTSPENSQRELLGMIDKATRSIDFYAEVIRDDRFITALGGAMRRGVAVRLITNESSEPLDQDVFQRLAAAGIEIRFSSQLYIHAKLMIVDGNQAFVGSQNPTETSFDANREVGLIIDAPLNLARCTAVFERDWAEALPFSPELAVAWTGGIDIS